MGKKKWQLASSWRTPTRVVSLDSRWAQHILKATQFHRKNHFTVHLYACFKWSLSIKLVRNQSTEIPKIYQRLFRNSEIFFTNIIYKVPFVRQRELTVLLKYPIQQNFFFITKVFVYVLMCTINK